MSPRMQWRQAPGGSALLGLLKARHNALMPCHAPVWQTATPCGHAAFTYHEEAAFTAAGLLSFILHLDKHLSAIIARHGQATYAILFAIVFAETGFVLTPFLPGELHPLILASVTPPCLQHAKSADSGTVWPTACSSVECSRVCGSLRADCEQVIRCYLRRAPLQRWAPWTCGLSQPCS